MGTFGQTASKATPRHTLVSHRHYRRIRPIAGGAGATALALPIVPAAREPAVIEDEPKRPADHGRSYKILLTLQLAYAALLAGWLVYTHTWPAPDIVALAFLAFAFLAARGLRFLRDWSPFILLLLGYIALTGITTGLVPHVHEQFPINADKWLFHGSLPTTFLQAKLWNPQHIRWYDYAAVILYPMHFVVPLVVAFVFWMWKKRLYWKFVGSYLLLSYAGFVTYVLYPMAPPWWAANDGRIAAVIPIMDNVKWGSVANPIVLATQYFRPNPVAAMPSIHAAFPVLVWLVLWRVWPKWGWATVVYPLGMAFSVVYLGEHYVIDCIAGWLYAVVAYFIVWGDYSWIRRRSPQPAVSPVEAQSALRHRSRRIAMRG